MKRITTPFGYCSTADEVAEGIDMSGKQVVITGGASGIGLETARTLAHIGAEVTLAVRNTDAGKQAAADIVANTGNQHVQVLWLDIVDRASIAAFVAGWTRPLDVLQGVCGRYFEDCNEALVVTNGNGYASGVAPYALSAENADRLWEVSLRLLA